MIEPVARALARRLRDTRDPAVRAGLAATMRAGGYDPDTTEPDDPQGYNARGASNSLAWHPGYLTCAERDAGTAAREAALGGRPF